MQLSNVPTIEDFASGRLQDLPQYVLNATDKSLYSQKCDIILWLIRKDLITFNPYHPCINHLTVPVLRDMPCYVAHQIWEDYQALVIKADLEFYRKESKEDLEELEALFERAFEASIVDTNPWDGLQLDEFEETPCDCPICNDRNLDLDSDSGISQEMYTELLIFLS